MKKLLTLLLFSNLLFSLLQAQPVHQIKGTVIEKNSRQPLEFINVMVLGLNKGGVTNAEGHFTIEQVPPGIYRLQATAIGYNLCRRLCVYCSLLEEHIALDVVRIGRAVILSGDIGRALLHGDIAARRQIQPCSHACIA